jgi:hypothetical protein
LKKEKNKVEMLVGLLVVSMAFRMAARKAKQTVVLSVAGRVENSVIWLDSKAVVKTAFPKDVK